MKHGIGRKLLSIVLSVMMLVSLLPTTAFAADSIDNDDEPIVVNDVKDVDETGNVAESTNEGSNGAVVNESEGEESTAITTNDDLAKAIAAASDGDTIKLGEGEFTTHTYVKFSPKKSLTFVGDGAGKTIWEIGDLSKNVDAEANGDYSFDGWGTVTFKNMTLKSDNYNYRGFICINNTVVENCTLEGRTAYWGYNTAKFVDSTFKAPEGDYALWDYSTKDMSFDGCTFNISGKGVNCYVEQVSDTERTITVKDCTVKSTDANKAFLNIKNAGARPQAWGVELVGNNEVEGLAVNSTTNSALYEVEAASIKDTDKQKTVTVKSGSTVDALETVYEVKAPVATVAKTKDGTTYTTLEAALAAVTESNPLTSVTEDAWPEATPVYYNGKFYATIGELLYDAQQEKGVITPETAPNEAVIYCRPGAKIATGKASHPSFVTSTTIYGNGATLSGSTEWDVENYYTLTKDITINLYSLNGGASVWGTRRSDFTVTVNMVDCKDAHEVLFNYGSGNGRVDVTVKDSTFLKSGGAAHGWPVSINCLGSLLVDGCTFDGVTTGVVVNVKQPSENGTMDVTVKNSTFNNVTGQDNNKGALRVTGQKACDIKLTIENVEFTGTHAVPEDITIGNVKSEENLGKVSYTISGTAASMTTHKAGATEATKATLESTKSYTGTNAATATGDGTEANPYTLAQLGAMTRAEYIAAQTHLGGTMYVTVGDYTYDTDGVLGNGVRNDTPGQTPDHSKLNAYGENGYLGEKNDGANGKNIVFVGSSITSNVTGYTSIDNIGTSLLLAVPAYTNVTFKGITFNNVMSFNYQLYTSPWSQLGELKFDGCTFNGIIVGAIAAQTLTFNGCEFKNYTNTTDANSSNPTWIRPAYGNWNQGDNEGQGGNFKSLTTINFTDNKVTSTRPVKFEFISQWDITSTVTATGNYFDISKQDGDTEIKNVGLYLGAHTDANAFNLVAEKNTKSENTAALYTIPEGKTSLPLGSTVKNSAGEQIELNDALKWKARDAATDKIVLKTVEAVASIGDKQYSSLQAAIDAAAAGDTVKLLKNCSGNGIQIKTANFADKGLIVDFGDFTYTVGGVLVGSEGTGTNAFQLLQGGKITFKNGTIAGVAENTKPAEDTPNWHGAPAIVIQNYCDLTLKGMTVSGGDETVYTMSNNCGNVVIENTTINAGKAKGYTSPAVAFDVCRYSSYPSVTVTVKGNSVINGDVEVSGTIGEGQSRQLYVEGGKFTGEFKVSGNVPANIAISGGTFDNAVLPEYCANGFIPTKNADGTFGVKQGTYVAETNGVKYESLQAAIDAAKSGATVKMLADTKENVTVSKNPIVLELNGYTLSGGTENAKPALTVNNKNVTLQDSSVAQTGTIKREDTAETKTSHYVIDIQGGNGFMVVNSGNVENNSGIPGVKGSSLIRLGNDSVSAWPTLTIKGGKFTQDNFIAIKVERGTLHFMGGEVNSANSYAIENWSNAYIKGGTVNGTASSWVYSTGVAFSKLEISGGKVNGNVASVNYDSAADKQARIFITGGEVTGTLGTYTYSDGLVPTEETSMATIEVTGGTFVKDPTKYVVEGSTVKTNEDGKFGVEKAYLAKVGDNSYYTMDEAFHAAVASGETLYLLRDYTTDAVQNSGSKSFTIDLGGFTWTYTGTDTSCAAFEINYPDVTLTVKNGKVVSGSMVGLIPTAMSGSIKYDNAGLVFENVVMTANGHSGIETNGGNTNDTVTLKNSTLNVLNGYGIYFPSSGTLTIDNSTINAKTMGVQVCAGSLSINEGSAITVTGDAVPKTENDGAIQDGAAISIVNRTGYKGLGKIEVTGGKFTAKAGNDAIKAYDWANNAATDFTANDKVAVSGGTFSSAVPEGLCAPGYVPTAVDADGNYTVEKVMVAQIGEVKYGTLAEAVEAAKNGDTVKLLTDIDTPKISYKISKSLTIDLNGKTVTGDGYDAVFQIDNADAKVLIKNGNIVAVENTGSAGKYAMAIWACKAECEVTLENLNVRQKITHTDDKQMDMIYTSGGTIIINSGNFVSGTPAWTLNCKDAAYKAGTANIIVKGGTFTGFDPANNAAEGAGTNFVAAGYKSVNNNDGIYTVTVNENVVAVIGTKEYADLFQALKDAAKNDGTVLLMADVDADKDLVQVRAGVTLNLNGYSITNVDLLRVTGQIIDTSDANARGIVSAEDYVITPLNDYTPVYNSAKGGYSFFDLWVISEWDNENTMGIFALGAYTDKEDNERIAAKALMEADLSRVDAMITFSWESQGTVVTQTFTYQDAKMLGYLSKPKQALNVVVSGLDQISGSVKMQAQFVFYKENGAELFTLCGESVPVK